jgi:hypothetical protein
MRKIIGPDKRRSKGRHLQFPIRFIAVTLSTELADIADTIGPIDTAPNSVQSAECGDLDAMVPQAQVSAAAPTGGASWLSAPDDHSDGRRRHDFDVPALAVQAHRIHTHDCHRWLYRRGWRRARRL